jgi:mannitol-1-phosphate/altronate dehydrogenase
MTVTSQIRQTTYDAETCEIGIVHLGFGAFHRAHQAVFIDDYMQTSGDLRWGIAAVNLRGSESAVFADHTSNGYLLQSVAPNGDSDVRRVRSHLKFVDWAKDQSGAEALLAQPSVHMVTITVTESGYYTDPAGDLKADDPAIAAEMVAGANDKDRTTVYAYLAAGLKARKAEGGAPITVCCCDNIRHNGSMLKSNFLRYLTLIDETPLASWVAANVSFPCSMVDRITPRATQHLADDLSAQTGTVVKHPVLAEAFTQWVLEDNFAGPTPALDQAGVTITRDVNPYEETKIRVLNGGHTCLTYLAALQGIDTFDQAMRVPELFDHFWNFETHEVLPALTLELPFSKQDYLEAIAARFKNEAIADTVARICADGFAKFPIFIRPTLEGCLAQGLMPKFGITSIASWHCFAQHVTAGQMPFDYNEPSWSDLSALIGTEDFVTSKQLWGDLPITYPAFADALRDEIKRMELKWPV